MAECWWCKWLLVIQILGLLNPLKEGLFFPWVYIKLMVVLDDGRGRYRPRNVKLTWNARQMEEWVKKRQNKCLNKLQVAGVGLIIVSLCSLNSPVQNLGKVCCRNSSAA